MSFADFDLCNKFTYIFIKYQIKISLNNIGIRVSQKHIDKQMKEMNLVCKQTRIHKKSFEFFSIMKREELSHNFYNSKEHLDAVVA